MGSKFIHTNLNTKNVALQITMQITIKQSPITTKKLRQNTHPHELPLFPPTSPNKLPINNSTSVNPIKLTNNDAHRYGIRAEKRK